MIIKSANGIDIDTESKMYQDYLRETEEEEKFRHISDPAPYRTLGDVLEMERRRHEREAAEQADAQTTDEMVPA